MKKTGNKDKLLREGLRLVHEHGLAGASVRDITGAAGVPLGSFTNHFTSKNAFGLEVIDLYRVHSEEIVRATLRNDALPPLERLAGYIDASRDFLNQNRMRDGCLCGNISAEANDHSDEILDRVVKVFADDEGSITYCLEAAVKKGELPAGTPVQDLAGVILSSLQGAFLIAKARRNPEPVDRLKRVLFSQLLGKERSISPES
jgi:TetR/AcrR family transcriptional repressor of nem operon